MSRGTMSEEYTIDGFESIDTEIRKVIEKVLAQNEENVKCYFDGKTRLFGFFAGEVMKETKGKANSKLVNKLLQEMLDEFAS